MSSENWVDSPRLHIHLLWLLDELEPHRLSISKILAEGVMANFFCYSCGASSKPPAIPQSVRDRSDLLEAVSKPLEAYHCARELYESMIHKAVVLMANKDASIVTYPGNRSLDFPTSLVSAELSTILRRLANASASVRADQIPALFHETFPQWIAVIATISNQGRHRCFLPRYGLQRFFNQSYFRRRRAGDGTCHRNSRAISHHHPLCTLSTFGFSDLGTPFFAGAKLPSTNTSCQSKWPRSSSSSMNACHISMKTPASSHSCNRRQQVLAEGYLSGRSLQRAPLLQTHRMPSKQSRSSAGGRSPRGDRTRSGMNFLIRSHCSSVSKRPFTAIEKLLSMNSETNLFLYEVKTGFATASTCAAK